MMLFIEAVYPEEFWDNDSKMAKMISLEFHQQCLEEDIKRFKASVEEEDFELESRKIEYGYNYDKLK